MVARHWYNNSITTYNIEMDVNEIIYYYSHSHTGTRYMYMC